MGVRAPHDEGVTGVACRSDATTVTSPHLLVAQAVAAALRSAGLAVEAVAWSRCVRPRTLDDAETSLPDRVVVILDGLDSLDVIADLEPLAHGGLGRLVVVTSEPAAVWCGALLAEDAVEVVTSAVTVVELADLVRRVVAGEALMEPAERIALRAAWMRAMDRRRHLAEQMATLTPQQRRVLELLASGLRVAEVGKVVGVTSGTVRSHVKALRNKLGARTQLEAVAMLRQFQAEGPAADLVPRPRQAVADSPHLASH